MLRTSFIYSIVTVRLSSSSFELASVGQERFELSTPRLSSACSNQLSYWPVGLIGPSRPNSKPGVDPEVHIEVFVGIPDEQDLTANRSIFALEIDRNRLDRSR